MQGTPEQTKDTSTPGAYRHKVYMRRTECAEVSGLSTDYFARIAWKGEGPPFVKPSGPRGPALYPVKEFFEWLHGLGKDNSGKEEG